MALSGTFYKNVNSHWRLQGEWSASQSISGNYSNVTLKVYWMCLDKYGTTYTSVTKSGSSTINGSSDAFSASAKLTGSEKKLVQTHTVKVNHNSDGTKSFSMSAYFDIKLDLSPYVSRVSISDTVTLNTIPRKSSLTDSTPNFTAGSDIALGISRASSSFTHYVHIDVKNSSGTYVNVKMLDFGSSTSKSTSFTTAEKTKIFDLLAGRSSTDVRWNFHTESGGSSIGYNTYYSTVTAPSASTISSGTDRDVYIDQAISIGITRRDSEFTHTLKIYSGGNDPATATLVKTITGVTTSVSWTPTQAEMDKMYATTPNSKVVDGNIEVYTYYGSELVRSHTDNDINFHVRNSNPTFADSNVTYEDTNATTLALTGNKSYIIQNKSDLKVTVTAPATAKNGATISKYVISVNGVEKTINTTGYATIGAVNATTNLTLTVEAIDSRGNSAKLNKPITIVPYGNPVVSTSATRLNNFENTTTLTLNGKISPLTIGGVDKNSIKTIQYRLKESTSSTYQTPVSFTYTMSGSSYTATNKSLNLDNGLAWDIEVTVKDALNTTTVVKRVAVGQPIFFIDGDNKAIGINAFPKSGYALHVEGSVLIDGKSELHFDRDRTNTSQIYWNASSSVDYGLTFKVDGNTSMILDTRSGVSSKIYGDLELTGGLKLPANKYASTGGGIDLNNSDMIGLNQLFFSDTMTSDTEALQFPKSSRPTGSLDPAHHDSFRIYNGVGYLNGTPIFLDGRDVLWDGASFMYDGQYCVPSRNLIDCPNGWILHWSDYDDSTNTENPFNSVYSVVPKHHFDGFNGQGIYILVPANDTETVTKYVYVNNERVIGYAGNNSNATHRDIVLSRVLAW
ncbi:DUF859 domain-containing protein [Cytobacillus kochii]|uniref:DUF859 family phage minor structural protein n=1 Tax=Cytobacillus kochii TaxID=859143 RepID=UPI001CD727F6|nr:DUF859 family phage minor structural protein [Cytobacillus kochii]MCA1025793.1 DUF859 domain-containing protein [Cytobacillus kochii]